MEFTYSKDHVGGVKAKKYIDGLEEHTFVLTESQNAPTPLLSKAYPEGRVPINSKKIEDIIKLRPYVPDTVKTKTFYDEIRTWSTIAKD